jgi:hypothetical protein
MKEYGSSSFSILEKLNELVDEKKQLLDFKNERDFLLHISKDNSITFNEKISLLAASFYNVLLQEKFRLEKENPSFFTDIIQESELQVKSLKHLSGKDFFKKIDDEIKYNANNYDFDIE